MGNTFGCYKANKQNTSKSATIGKNGGAEPFNMNNEVEVRVETPTEPDQVSGKIPSPEVAIFEAGGNENFSNAA